MGLAVIRRKDIKTSSYAYVRVCSDHFLSGKPSPLYDTTNPDWVPSLKLGHNNCSSADTSRHDRASARAVKRRKVQEAVDDDEEREVLIIEQEEAVQDDNGGQSKEVDILTAELAQTKDLNASRLVEAVFRRDNDNVLYYSGLPTWEPLHLMFTFLQIHLPASRRAFQKLLMTLMRLRLNLPGQDFAYRFGVHTSTVNHIILFCK